MNNQTIVKRISKDFKRPIFVGVAGGTGSGKTTVVREILKRFSPGDVLLIQHDSYYKDRNYLPTNERENINYDHPDALETPLLVKHLRKLSAGQAIEMPIYDFVLHVRKPQYRRVEPCKVIIIEGILILTDPELLELIDIKIFVDTDVDICFIRRMERDIAKRGRTRDSVIRQYLKTVKPMYIDFVEPSRRNADLIVPWRDYNSVAVDMLITKIRSVLKI